MDKEDLKALRTRLKTGEYDGTDIMQSWIAIDELIDRKEQDQLFEWSFNNHVQVAQYGTWYGTYTGDERPAGSDGCISYEQTFLTALKQAKVNLGV